MEDDYLGGDGTEADFINSYGSNYVYNQTPFDAIDNGQVSQQNGTTTVKPATWTETLGGLFTTGLGLYNQAAPVINQLTGKPTAPAAVVAQPTAGAAVPGSKGGFSMPMLLGIGGAIIAAAFWFFKKR